MNKGWYGVALFHPKHDVNIGGVLRSAACFDASCLFIIGKRHRRYSTDTTHTTALIPTWEYTTFEEFRQHRPYDAQFVGVEITPNAIPLESFTHPSRAVYIGGPEDGGLSKEVLARCKHVVQIDTKFCLNLASAMTIVFYDRQTKEKLYDKAASRP